MLFARLDSKGAAILESLNPQLSSELTLYTKMGWRLIPLHSVRPDGRCTCGDSHCEKNAGKHPRISAWQKNASADLGQVTRWATQFPGCNWGLACGEESNVLALDIDMPFGLDSLKELESAIGEELPETVINLTGSGGQHWLYHYPKGRHITNAVKLKGLFDGIDVRSNNGYIVLPPSIHQTGRHYEWDVAHHPEGMGIAALPETLIHYLESDPVLQFAQISSEPWKPLPIEVAARLPEVCERLGKSVADADGAAQVKYPEWIGFASWARAAVADSSLFDEWSRPYPKYNAREVQKKWKDTEDQVIPYTCQTMQTHRPLPECETCPIFQSKYRNPVAFLRAEYGQELGLNRPYGAPSYVEAIQEGYESDGVEWLQGHKDLVDKARRFEPDAFFAWLSAHPEISEIVESTKEPEPMDEEYLNSLGAPKADSQVAPSSRPRLTVLDGGATAADLNDLPPDMRKQQMAQNAESVIEQLFVAIDARSKDASQISDPSVAYAFAVLRELNTPAFQKLSAVAKEYLKRSGMNLTVFSQKIHEQVKSVKTQLRAVNIPAKGKDFNRIGNKYYPSDVQQAPIPTKYPDAYYLIDNGRLMKKEWVNTKEGPVETMVEVADTVIAVVNLREPFKVESGLDKLPRVLHLRTKESRGWVDLDVEVADALNYHKLIAYANVGLPMTTNNAPAIQGYLSETVRLICQQDELEDLITTYVPHVGWIGRDYAGEWDYLIAEGTVGGMPVEYMDSPFVGDANVIHAVSVRRGDATKQAQNILRDLVLESEMATFIAFAVGSPLTLPLNTIGVLGMRGFLVEFVSGEGATGKSTTTKMAMSLFSGVSENENLEVFRLTMNSLAPKMYAGGGIPIFYDEPQASSSPKSRRNEGELKTILFEIAKGKSKARNSALGANRSQVDFGGLLLMTANASYVDLSSDEVGDGEMQRIISLRPKMENTPERGKKMEEFEQRWLENAGSLHPYLAKKYLEHCKTPENRKRLGEMHQMYTERLKQMIHAEAVMKEIPWDPSWDGKLTRFIKLNAVGILGMALLSEVVAELLPEKADESQRLINVVTMHLAEVTFRQILSGERLTSPADRARDFIEEVIASRGFEICPLGYLLNKDKYEHTEWIGYWKSEETIAFLPSKLRDVLMERGFAPTQIFKTWAEQGVIRRGKDEAALTVVIAQLGNKRIKAVLYKIKE